MHCDNSGLDEKFARTWIHCNEGKDGLWIMHALEMTG